MYAFADVNLADNFSRTHVWRDSPEARRYNLLYYPYTFIHSIIVNVTKYI